MLSEQHQLLSEMLLKAGFVQKIVGDDWMWRMIWMFGIDWLCLEECLVLGKYDDSGKWWELWIDWV